MKDGSPWTTRKALAVSGPVPPPEGTTIFRVADQRIDERTLPDARLTQKAYRE